MTTLVSLRPILLGSTSLLWIVTPSVALAQSKAEPASPTASVQTADNSSPAAPPAAPAQTTDNPPPAEPAKDGSDIVVTGSRIVRDGYEQPTPVTVAPIADLEKATPTNIPDALNKLPQFANSVSPRGNDNLLGNSGQHGNILDLRGVGGLRVLSLLNGTRVPPTSYKGAVDANTIPQLLVQRVDVVTAGASAVYGSDAVSGVVNYVLDTKFTGLKGVAQYGISTRGDLPNYRLGLAGGISFAGGRGHLLASVERFDARGIDRGSRIYGGDAYAAVGSVVGSPAVAGTAANPLIFVGNLRSLALSYPGLITASSPAGLAVSQFQPGGSILPVNRGTPTGTANTYIGGDGYFAGTSNTLSPPLTTTQGYARASYEFSDNLSAHVEGNFAQSDTSYNTQAQSILGFTIFSGNAFLNPAIQSALGPNGNFTLFRYFDDHGPIPATEKVSSYMIDAGLDGKIGSWSWKATYTHGNSITHFAQRGFQIQKLAAALDAVRDPSGNIVCKVSLTNPGLYPGCVPFNPFGPGSVSDAAFNYALGTSRYRARNSTDDWTLSAQGALFNLPAGPVDVVVGLEYRKQGLAITSNSDPTFTPDFTGLRGIPATRRQYFNNTNVGQAFGSLNVKEAFGELNVPLFKDTPFLRELSLNAAGRVTDYSTSGRVETWKLGAVWKPVNDLTFRITRSRDIRAPTLFDLFAGIQTNPTTLIDPHTNVNASFRVVAGGNPNLQPEVGTTLSFGLVAKPKFLPGFSISVDYYHLRINGAITTQSVSDILNECEQSNGASPTCALIQRPFPFSDHSTANFPIQVSTISQNISFLDTRGIDIDASYRTTLGNGALQFRLYANIVDRFLQQNNSVAPVYDYAGYGANGTLTAARPKFKGTLSVDYEVGPVGIFVQETLIGKMKLGPTQVYAEPDIKPVPYTDLTLTYRPPVRGAPSLFFTVTNLLDRKPPLVAAPSSPGLYYPTLYTLYDVVGRTYTAGIRFKF